MTYNRIVVLFGFAILFSSCSSKDRERDGSAGIVVMAIEGDVDSFNPLFAEEIVAGEVNDLLFPALVGSEFDATTGTLEYKPLLSRSWESVANGKDLLFHIRQSVSWSDGTPVSAGDVQFSYSAYGDPKIASIRQASVEKLRRTDGVPDITKSVEVIDDSTVVFHFEESYSGQLFDAGLPILPAHVFGSVPRSELRLHQANKNPIVSGPFIVKQWTPMQEIILSSNPASVLPSPARLDQLVFRVVTEPSSRLAQLMTGEVDVVSGISVEDTRRLKKEAAHIEIISTPGRDYDFVGWNNIDPDEFGNGSIRPHPLFGNSKVRRALTMAINRKELVDAYLGEHGEVAFGGISPLFRWAYNDKIDPYPFDPDQATILLREQGWRDSNGDGTIDKRGREFSFALTLPTGNALREAVALAIQQSLKQIGIEVRIEKVERGAFWENALARRYDAWISGFSVPLQMQLDDLWGSDLERYPFNLTGIRNDRIDEILAASRSLANETDGAELWKEFQQIIHEEQPCTFLFWINSLIAVNRRVQGTHVGTLGTLHNAWDWHVEGVTAERR